jgi:hypothetical protein
MAKLLPPFQKQPLTQHSGEKSTWFRSPHDLLQLQTQIKLQTLTTKQQAKRSGLSVSDFPWFNWSAPFITHYLRLLAICCDKSVWTMECESAALEGASDCLGPVLIRQTFRPRKRETRRSREYPFDARGRAVAHSRGFFSSCSVSYSLFFARKIWMYSKSSQEV